MPTRLEYSLPVTGPALYVATDGNDRNPGTKERPLRTLPAAKHYARKLKQSTKAAITVYLRQGTYYLKETLVFEPEDSGTPERPITYAAYPNEVVTLSGGTRLHGSWTHYKNGIMKCPLDGQAGKFTQLFVNGKRQVRARYPKYDSNNPFRCRLPLSCQGEAGGYCRMANREVEWPATKMYFDPSTFTKKRWAMPQEAVVHAYPETYIGNLQWKVKNIDWDAHTIEFGKGGYQINDLVFKKKVTGIGPHSRFFVENIFEELEDPGEWYLSTRDGILYYKPIPGQELLQSLVEAPILKHIIEFRGSQEEPVRHVRLEGFRVAHTASTFLEAYEAPSLGDWTIYRGGAIFLDGTEDCSIEDCFFDAVGGNAVFINNYNRRTRLYGNKFTYTGDSAVCLVGTKNRAIGSSHPYPAECLISNNLVHDCGEFGKQTAAVFASISERNTISHNWIYNMPRSAICINDGWGGGHVIEFNDVHDVVRDTQDHGSFNSWGRETHWCMGQSHPNALPGISHPAGDVKQDCRITNIVRNNYFHETTYNEWAIDLDDGTSNYHVYNNLCVGVGITHREGDYRTIENNIMIHPKNPPGPKLSNEKNSDRFVCNIVVTDLNDGPTIIDNEPGDMYSVIYPPLHEPCATELDYNLFFCAGKGEFYSTVMQREPKGRIRYKWDEWRALGYDQHSVIADPMFIDAANVDYRVRPESPALKLGFKNFDISSVGLLNDFPRQWMEEAEIAQAAKKK